MTHSIDVFSPKPCHLSSTRHRLAPTLLIADVDHFKRFNDVCSHAVGDATLRRIAPLLHETGDLSVRRSRKRWW